MKSLSSECFHLIFIAVFVGLMSACDNDDSPEQLRPDNTIPDPDFVPEWTTVLTGGPVSASSIFIGDSYTSVYGYGNHDDPMTFLYLGATAPADVFPKSLRQSNLVEKQKHSADVYADFNGNDSFLGESEGLKYISYRKFLNAVIGSQEYAKFLRESSWTRLDYSYCDAKTVGNLMKLFPDNELFAKGMMEVVKDVPNLADAKSVTVGRVAMKSFSTHVDGLSGGLFVNPEDAPEGAVYINSLTYGATAYFVVVSDRSYEEVSVCLRTEDVKDAFDNPDGKLHNSTIVSFINNSHTQNATVVATYDELDAFLKQPFTETDYGYPIYCDGRYASDNSTFKPKE